jgi:hypothetical protein
MLGSSFAGVTLAGGCCVAVRVPPVAVVAAGVALPSVEEPVTVVALAAVGF